MSRGHLDRVGLVGHADAPLVGTVVVVRLDVPAQNHAAAEGAPDPYPAPSSGRGSRPRVDGRAHTRSSDDPWGVVMRPPDWHANHTTECRRPASYASPLGMTKPEGVAVSSGNSLAGSEAMERVTVRVHQDRLAAFDAAVEDHEEWANRSEALRDLMDTATGRGTPDWLPDDEELARAYRALRRNANADTGKISTDTAKTVVAEATRVEKGAVKDRIFPPLEERDLIAPKWGRIYVRIPNDSHSGDR